MTSVSEMYALRSCLRLVLPNLVQENISNLRRTAMAFKPFNKAPRYPRVKQEENWREKLLVEMVRKVKEREDPEYSEVFSIFNKIAKTNMEKLSTDVIVLILKRDDQFRLRVSTLLFDKAITNHSFASVMADCALKISQQIPEVIDDLSMQVSMFDTLYNMNDTIVYPAQTDPDCSKKIIEWTIQKEKRRGYAKFLTELNIRNLVSEECLQNGLEDVVREFIGLLELPKTPQTEENIHQCAVFLYETAKLIPKTSTTSRTFIRTAMTDILQHSIGMKTKFKIQDALKLVC